MKNAGKKVNKGMKIKRKNEKENKKKMSKGI